MSDAATSPRIVKDGWGRIEIDDGRSFKDVKLWPGGGREWDWNETGTDHHPGIQPEDVDELLENGAEVVILTRGRNRRLSVPDETVARVEAGGAEAEVLPTDQAIQRYNELCGERPVGGLFHSTC